MPSNPFWTNAAIDILLVIYVLDCAFMGLVIMMQRSKQEGLGAAFGGGITDSIWGAQTSQVLVKATVYAAAIFFVCSILLARLYSHRASLTHQGSGVQMELEKGAVTPPVSTNAALSPSIPTSPANAQTPAIAAPSKTAAPTLPPTSTKSAPANPAKGPQ